MVARALNFALAVYLLVSLFTFVPHGALDKTFYSVALGMPLLLFPMMAMEEPSVRFAISVWSVLLAVVALTFHHPAGWTRWHDLTLAVVNLAVSLVPNPRARARWVPDGEAGERRYA